MGETPGSPLTWEAHRARKYMPELDGLRALSVLMVITVHMHDKIWEWLGGRLGVTVFFVISGYLITTLSLREESDRGTLSLKAFYIRRCFRIFPLYYFVLGLYCVLILVAGVGGPERAANLLWAMPYYLLYMQEVPFFSAGLDIPFSLSWSLGIEEKFYLVWPLLAFVFWRGRLGWRLGGTTVLALALIGLKFLPVDDSVASCLYEYYHILLGCLLALLLENETAFARLRFLGSGVWVFPALAVVLALHFTIPQMGVTNAWYIVVLSFYSLAVAVFLACLLLGEGPLQKLFRLTPLVFIGRVSYGIYLIHVLCINAVDKVIHPGQGSIAISIAAYVVAAAVSVGVAYVLHRVVEKPLIEIGRRWSKRVLSEPRPAAATAPVG